MTMGINILSGLSCSFFKIIITVLLLWVPGIAKDLIVSIQPNGEKFIKVFNSLKNELEDDFIFQPLFITKNSTPQVIQNLLVKDTPVCLILMDNIAIRLYRKYLATRPSEEPVLPSISIMGILIDKATEGLRNAGGIAYEVPVVTGAVNLRAVVSTPIKKIGIVHRECLDNFIAANVSFCKKESIDIISISLPNKSSLFKWKIKSALKTLSRNKIDALWIPNDNLLLQRDNLFDVWIPAADKLEIPVIVGIETLVDPKLDFGTLAVLPDHVGLGKQTADMIYELSGNNWKFKEHQIFPPLAIHKIINLRQAKERFNISDDKLGIIDKKLE